MIYGAFSMPRLCFKTRSDGQTVQLVHHVYNPTTQRSRTVTLGSLRRDTDPEAPETGLRKVPGITLDAAQHADIRQWLLSHGDADAATRRQALLEQLKAKVRAELLEQSSPVPDPFEQAVQALQSLSEVLPELSKSLTASGEDPWKTLRPGYMAVYHAWETVLETAKAAGVAKQSKRVATAPQDPPSALGHPALDVAMVDASVMEATHDPL
jgi:hypothetical protein